MSTPVWIAIGGAVVVVAFAVWWFWPQAACNHNCKEKRYVTDHAHPLRRWIHGALAVYRGDVGDPAYWDEPCAQRQASAWGMKSPHDLQELLTRYHNGEINPAFDKARMIWLARVGQGVGWLAEDQSWQWCQVAAAALQQQYESWNLVAQDIEQGRVAWYDGRVPETEQDLARQSFRFASEQVLPPIPFR